MVILARRESMEERAALLIVTMNNKSLWNSTDIVKGIAGNESQAEFSRKRDDAAVARSGNRNPIHLVPGDTGSGMQKNFITLSNIDLRR